MFLLKVFNCCNKIQPRLKNAIFTYCKSQQNFIKKLYFSKIVDFNAQLKSDVLLYKGVRPKYFGLVHVFATVQLFYWTAFSCAIIVGFRGYEVKVNNDYLKWLFDKEKTYNIWFAAIFFLIGTIVYASYSIITLRLVESLTLHKGGMKITITTHKILGLHSKVEVPIRKVSAVVERNRATNYLPLKIQGKPFYFLMDMKGKFSNPLLFDQTAGRRRDFF